MQGMKHQPISPAARGSLSEMEALGVGSGGDSQRLSGAQRVKGVRESPRVLFHGQVQHFYQAAQKRISRGLIGDGSQHVPAAVAWDHIAGPEIFQLHSRIWGLNRPVQHHLAGYGSSQTLGFAVAQQHRQHPQAGGDQALGGVHLAPRRDQPGHVPEPGCAAGNLCTIPRCSQQGCNQDGLQASCQPTSDHRRRKSVMHHKARHARHHQTSKPQHIITWLHLN
mmetsp:Transcript_75948/g.173917  ORF Transcript_75948/g.173917 Transcript_75948/m.173917 type:complete len:223 (-) Transcript_75948:425-1093(-)